MQRILLILVVGCKQRQLSFIAIQQIEQDVRM